MPRRDHCASSSRSTVMRRRRSFADGSDLDQVVVPPRVPIQGVTSGRRWRRISKVYAASSPSNSTPEGRLNSGFTN